MRLSEDGWKRRLVYTLVSLIFLVAVVIVLALFDPVADPVNELTRVDAAEHVSDHRCGRLSPVCPAELECYQDFDPRRIGVTIPAGDGSSQGARCVTPAYADRYCGLFEYLTYRSSASISTIGECKPLTLSYILGHPESLFSLPKKLVPPPNGDDILDQYNFSSVAQSPTSVQNPESYVPCRYGGIALHSPVEYISSNNSIVVPVAITGARDLNITVKALQTNRTIGQTPTSHYLESGAVKNIAFTVNQLPDQVTTTSQDCPSVQASTTTITHQ